MDQHDQTQAPSPADVAAKVAPHVGATRTLPEKPARLTAVTAGAPSETVESFGLATSEPLRANPNVTDDVDDILLAVDEQSPAAGQPAVGVAVVMQHHPVAAQRELMSQVLTWPSAYVLFPHDRSPGAVATVRFSHRPQLRISFRACAVAALDDRGVWALDGELAR